MKVNISKKLDKKTFSAIAECIEIANIYGFEIYLVGGIVRDILLSKPLKDVDITVAGDAKKLVEIIECYVKTKSVKFDKSLPTAKIVFKNGTEIDFASTRNEIYEHFGDLPKVTNIGCPLKEDVLRRDFSINSIAISLNKKNLFEVIDYLGGIDDLKLKKLRILHEKSFYDDPSRIIRGLKFAERLNFELEDKTLKLQNKYLRNPLRNIPLERVKSELTEAFSLNKKTTFEKFIREKIYRILIDDFDISITSEQIRNSLFDFKITDEDIWLLYLLIIFAKDNPPQKLNLTTRELKIIKDIQNFYDAPLTNFDNYSIYKYFQGKDYLSVVFYGILFDLKPAKLFLRKLTKIKIQISGIDLKEMGIQEGKIYSEIQDAVLQEKLNNHLSDKNEEVEFVKEFLKIRN